MAVALLIWSRGRRAEISFARDQAALTAALQRQKTLLDQAPSGLLLLEGEKAIVTPGLARLLRIEGELPDRIDGVAAHFDSAEFEAFSTAVSAWSAGGEAPRTVLTSCDGTRSFEVVGFGGTDGDESRAVAFYDIGEHVERHRRSEARAEQAEAGGERLRKILDAVPLPIWERDAKLKLSWCNAAYARTVVREAADVIASGDIEIEPAIMVGHGQALARAARDQDTPQEEVRHIVVDGKRRALNVIEVPGSEGEFSVGYAEDATAREEIAADYKRFVDANTDVMNNLNSAIVVFGPDRHVTFSNEAYARVWKLDEAWLATRPSHSELLDAIRDNRLLPEEANYPAFKEQTMALYNDLMETIEEFRFLPDGRVLRRLSSPHPLGGLLMVFEDVTDRMLLERSYNTLNAVQQETLANLHEAIAVFGSDGRLKLYNLGLLEMWGLEEELLANGEPHISELVDNFFATKGEFKNYKRSREKIIARTTERNAESGRLELSDGRVIDYAKVPLPDGNNLYSYLDVTDSVQIERALRERAEALETADRLKTEFIANISYELRSPLNVIMGFTELLDNEYFGSLNEQQRGYCRGILESSQLLLDIINNILDLASIEAGRLELDAAAFDVHETLAGLIELNRENAERLGIEMTLDCPVDVGDIVGDERRIRQVVYNLLSNAIKFSESGDSITLGARRENGEVTLWVEDQGAGIEKDEQAVVFDRFQRGSQTSFGRGAGLGLAMVKSFVELHGGRVELISEPDSGTRVTVSLPANPDLESVA